MALADRVPPWLRRALQPAYPLYRAFRLWSEADGARMSAAMSFYGILSLAPLLLAVVGILGWWMDRSALEQGLVSQISAVIGDKGGAMIQQALDSARDPDAGRSATLVGFAVLLFAATGVFSELQRSLERLWSHGREPQPKPPWWHMAALRLRGVGYVLVFGFLLLVSLAISALLTLFSGWAGAGLPLETLLRVANELVGLLFGAALFFGVMRLSSGPKPRARYLVLGAFVAAILFTVGRQLLTMYLATAAVVSAYGAAGSLIVLLLWIFFSSAVLLFGAGCARAVEDLRQERDAAHERASGRSREGLALRTP